MTHFDDAKTPSLRDAFAEAATTASCGGTKSDCNMFFWNINISIFSCESFKTSKSFCFLNFMLFTFHPIEWWMSSAFLHSSSSTTSKSSSSSSKKRIKQTDESWTSHHPHDFKIPWRSCVPQNCRSVWKLFWKVTPKLNLTSYPTIHQMDIVPAYISWHYITPDVTHLIYKPASHSNQDWTPGIIFFPFGA